MKKVFKNLAFIFIFPLIFLSGCFTFFDENDTTGGTTYDNITGFKLCYKDNAYELDNTYELYATHLLTELYLNFGIPNDARASALTTRPSTNTNANYDRIRVQTSQSDEIDASISWNWTFSQTIANASSLTSYTDTAQNYYSLTEKQTAYFTAFVEKYTTALEIVLIQIAMGETPSVFSISVSGQNTTVSYNGTDVNNEEKTYLASIKEDFKTKGDYIGLTTENVATLKTYILTNVVGNSVISNYGTLTYASSTKTYSTVIDEILATEASTLAKSIHSPYPTAISKDITNTSLYVANTNTPLNHIASAEYQSFVIMPNSSTSISSIWLALESEYNMTIKVSTYLHNGGRTTALISSQNVNITAGTWKSNNPIYLGFSNTSIPAFNNSLGDGKISASTAKYINNTNGNNLFYAYNENNVGVLDNGAVTGAYFEITFEITKTVGTDYYPFKVGIQSLSVG